MAKFPTTGIQSHQLLALDDFMQSPVVSNTLFKKYGNQYLTLIGILFAFGASIPVGASQFSAYEDDWNVGSFHVLTAVDASAPGTSHWFTASPEDLVNGRIYPSAKYIITMPNGNMGYIDQEVDFTTNPSAPRIHIRPVNLNKALGNIAAGTKLSTHSVAVGSGQYAAKGSVQTYNKRDFYCQIFSQSMQMDGEFMATQSYVNSWMELPNSTGTFNYWNRALGLQEYRHKLMVDGAYWFGQELSDPSTAPLVPVGDPGEGNPIYFTKGLIPHAVDTGLNVPLAAGDLSLQTFYDIDSYLDGQGGGSSPDQLMSCGVNKSHEFDKLMKTELNNTNVDYTSRRAAFMLGETDALKKTSLEADFRFSTLDIGSHAYHKYHYGLWSHPELYPVASGYKMKDQALIMPIGTINDGKAGVSMPIISDCYRSANGLNRKYRFNIFYGPGAEQSGGQILYETDIAKAIIWSHQGLRAMATKQLVYLNPNT